MNALQQIPQAAGAEPARGSGRKIKPLRSWRAHYDIGIAVFLVVVLLGIRFAWQKGKPRYMAQAVVLVSPRFLKNLEDDKEFELQSNTQYREFVQENVRTVKRYDIIEESVRRLDLSGHPWRRPKETLQHAIGRLQGDVAVAPVPDTYQITLSLEGDKPGGLAEAVNMVAAVFLEKSKDEEFFGRDQRLASLRDEEAALSASIAANLKEKDRLAQELGVSVFTESMINPFDHLLVGSKEALATARQKRIISHAELAALEARAPGKDSALHAYAAGLTEKNADLTAFQSNLNLRKSEVMAKLEGMLPNHPGRKQLEAELRDIDATLQAKSDNLKEGYSEGLLAQRRADDAAAIATEEKFQKEVDAQAVQAAWYSSNYQKGLNLRSEMERQRKRLESIEDRIDFIAQETRAPGFARPFSSARTPTDPISGGRKSLLIMVGMAGVVLALIVPIAMDMFDPRVLSPEEAEKRIGFPPLGFTLRGSGVRVQQSTEQLRRLAAAIERDVLRNGSRSFLFVPVNQTADAGDLIWHTAEELEALGHTVRVIASTQQLPVEQAVGVGNEASSDIFRHFSSADADISFGSTRKAITRAMRESEIALVATRPFVDAAESELLASTCDVVIMTLEASHTTRQEVQAATKVLERIQPKAVSMVVTGYDPDPPIPAPKISVPRMIRTVTSLPQKVFKKGENQ